MLKALINKDCEADYIVKKRTSNQQSSFKMLKGLYISNNIKINNENFEKNLGLFNDDNEYFYKSINICG